MQKIMEGGCHCGRVRFRVTANLDGVTQCNCSICAKKGFLHLIVSPQQFQLRSGKECATRLSVFRYRRRVRVVVFVQRSFIISPKP